MQMKKSEIVIRELLSQNRKIITSAELAALCKRYQFDFLATKKLLLNKKFFVLVFRGIYYVKDYAEKKTGMLNYSSYEMLSRALEIRGIKNWYFGLHTALKLLGRTHEVFSINYIINDTFNRVRPLNILGTEFLFVKLKPSLFFGFKKSRLKNGGYVRYSTLEKTVLDLIYLYKKGGRSAETVHATITEYKEELDKKKILTYCRYYPKSVGKTIQGELA